jgi:ammonium transporter, Amt family
MVPVTGSCGMVDHSATVFIGLVAGWVYMIVEADLIKLKSDDAVSAIPVHLGNGLWGVLAVGLFASPDRFFAAWRKDSHPGCRSSTSCSFRHRPDVSHDAVYRSSSLYIV